MNRRTTITVLSCTAIAGSLLAFLLLAVDWPPSNDAAIPEAVGESMAVEAQKLGGSSGNFIVIARDTSTFKQPAADLALASFLRAIRKGGGSISGLHSVELDPLRPVQVPSGDYMELLHSAPPGSVVVSFMGPPILTEEQRGQLGALKTKVVAFCSGNIAGAGELRRLFDDGLVHSAVVARYLLASSKSTLASSGGFDSQYLVISQPSQLGGATTGGSQP
ncbi:MAG TPA: hypothetical protein VMF06_00475 [Candidatus Limnocylindria bacterium]|nr:hypothetical protein [Candidatus Limnocylindria bacterium]